MCLKKLFCCIKNRKKLFCLYCCTIRAGIRKKIVFSTNKDTLRSLWTVASDVSVNCIWFYCFYEDSGDQAVSAGGILVMEGNPGDWYMWQTGKYYGRWFTAGESVEYSATFSGRDFIAGVDRQKTEMVDGIAGGNCGIICYRD